MDELRVAAVFRASTDRVAVCQHMRAWRASGLSVAVSHSPESTVYTACSTAGVVRVRAEQGMMSGSASFYGEPEMLNGHDLVKHWRDLIGVTESAGSTYVTWKGRIFELRFTRGLLCWDVVARTDWGDRSDWDLMIERETWLGHIHRYLDELARALLERDEGGQIAAVGQLARAEQHLQRLGQELAARRMGSVGTGRSSAKRG
ncbi:MAG: hypothetical protein IRY98_05860 [Alicyclobacillaceae bacterium]|nr:hypothetical protein [Alicyclobacillaceae bacterium]